MPQVNGSQLYSHELGHTGDFFVLPKGALPAWGHRTERRASLASCSASATSSPERRLP